MIIFDLPRLVFYLWWLTENGFIYYAEYRFLSRFSDKAPRETRYMLLYIGVNCLLTFFVISFQMTSFMREILHIGILCLFSLLFFQSKMAQITAPAVIIFTLSTFMDGISVTLMRLSVAQITSPIIGNTVHVILTAALALLFFFSLKFASGRYVSASRQTAYTYLYLLLLPCGFVVWLLRYGLGLNDYNLSSDNVPFIENPTLWALACILGSVILFVIVLEAFEKTIRLSRQKTENALLDRRLHEQSIYLAEAKKRDEHYRAFQHDINNHLIILSGLIREKEYTNAEQYLEKLHITANTLLSHISTGNPVLDVLLKEKISYANQNQITVNQKIGIPGQTSIEDMDLCIIFSNALDNAIQACISENSADRSIEIVTKIRHQFLLIEVTNPSLSPALVIPGTGLDNIGNIAKKYQGTLQFEKNGGFFRLSVLLCWNQESLEPSAKQD